jgi:hypothetical protein
MADKFETLLSVCSEAWRAENDVIGRLSDRAEKYIAAVGVILAFHVTELPKLNFNAPIREAVSSALIVLGMMILGVALILAIFGMRLRGYPTYATSENLRKLDARALDDEAVARSVAYLYLDMRDQILQTNQKRARGIVAAGYLLVCGFLLSTAGQIVARIA